jgi:PIN domain nuclease of toxin-antitoxin system
VKLLLDTHLLLLAAGQPQRLSTAARKLLDDPRNELLFSAASLWEVPPIHKDLFDRILIAQAMVEGIALLTSDALVAQYPGPVRLV